MADQRGPSRAARCVLARGGVSAAGAALCLLAAPGRGRRRPDAEAMAFIRVVADIRVDFGGLKPPIERKGLELATGSGFVVAASGLILTSLHVVAEDEAKSRFREDDAEVSIENRRIEVAIGGGGAAGGVRGARGRLRYGNDLAALQVTAGDLPYLPLGDSDALEAGRPVQVLGFPFGRQVEVGRRAAAGVVPEVTVTAGSLSAARANEEGDTRFLQTDATIQPGNSGGPMLDEDGYVVGVVRMKLARDATSQGAGFSVPVNVVKDFLEANNLLGLAPGGPAETRRPSHARLEAGLGRAARRLLGLLGVARPRGRRGGGRDRLSRVSVGDRLASRGTGGGDPRRTGGAGVRAGAGDGGPSADAREAGSRRASRGGARPA